MKKILLFFILALIAIASCKESRCFEPVKSGRCGRLIPHYAYSTQKGKCYMFIYGGCGGTGNNFERRSDCEAACEH